jgi:hypothetical protein
VTTVGWTLVPVLTAGLLATLGCREDESPTAPEPRQPSLPPRLRWRSLS